MQELNPRPYNSQPNQQPAPKGWPILGLVALGIAVLANYPFLGFLALLSMLLAIIALFKKQLLTGIFAILISIFALVTSVPVWLAAGGYYMYKHMDELPQQTQPYDRRAPEMLPPSQPQPPAASEGGAMGEDGVEPKSTEPKNIKPITPDPEPVIELEL